MRTFVINLDRCPERLASFRTRNGHVDHVERFSAIDGRDLSPQDLSERQIVRGDHRYTRNAIGSALSHMTLWERSVADDRPVCVIEDDAILSFVFARYLRALSESQATWDYVAWGWNFDAPLYFEFLPGVTPAKIETSQQNLRQNIDLFQKLDLGTRFPRLLRYHGIMCYSVSPRGANMLLRSCRPLGPGASTVDEVMNHVYPNMQALVAIPPLAVSENDHASSTIRNL